MGNANRERILEALKSSIAEIVPDVSPDGIGVHSKLRDLGASSMDRAEILTMTMQDLSVKLPLNELAQADDKDIAGLIEIFEKWLAR
jgi:polyketide biosynthesis acyl carrier protein